MRFRDRAVSRFAILEAVETYPIVEEYPQDKYLPSYLVLGKAQTDAIHI